MGDVSGDGTRLSQWGHEGLRQGHKIGSDARSWERYS